MRHADALTGNFGHLWDCGHGVAGSNSAVHLELSRLIFADFDRGVHRILAQPFLLKVKADGKIRKHIPAWSAKTSCTSA